MYVVNDCGILKEKDIKIMKDFYVDKNFIDIEKINR
jgi:hypothetical protein